jgi:16S rRNA (uracil1498-N3)-methyltransferase
VPIFYAPQIANGTYQLDETDSKHCVQVLRHQAGDNIVLADGKGWFYEARISALHPKRCGFELVRQWRDPQAMPADLHIAIAPPKNIARFEWFLEKATEIGISHITPLLTTRTERSELRLDRLEKIMIAAMKQTGKATLPNLYPPAKFAPFIAQSTATQYPIHCIAHIAPHNPHLSTVYERGKNALLLIGPEGDFTPDEVQTATAAGFAPVSLGNSILRVETAGVFVCSLVQIANA